MRSFIHTNIRTLFDYKSKKISFETKEKSITHEKQKEDDLTENTFINEYFVLIFCFKSNNFLWDEISVWYCIHFLPYFSSSRYQKITFICPTCVVLVVKEKYLLKYLTMFYIYLIISNLNFSHYYYKMIIDFCYHCKIYFSCRWKTIPLSLGRLWMEICTFGWINSTP